MNPSNSVPLTALLHTVIPCNNLSRSLYIPSPISLSLPAPTNPHHKLPFIYFLSPNQLRYKFKERSKATNFARSFPVTSVTLCPQAAIYKRRQTWSHYICKRWSEVIPALAMRAYRATEVWLHSFLISAPDGVV